MNFAWWIFGRALIVLLGLLASVYGIDVVLSPAAPESSQALLNLLQRQARGVLALVVGLFLLDSGMGSFISNKLTHTSKVFKRSYFASILILAIAAFVPSFAECMNFWCTLSILFITAFRWGVAVSLLSAVMIQVEPDVTFYEKSLVGSGCAVCLMGVAWLLVMIWVILFQ